MMGRHVLWAADAAEPLPVTDHHRRAVQFLEETLPDCRSLEIEGAGHGGPNSHPQEVSAAIQAFIDQPVDVGRQ